MLYVKHYNLQTRLQRNKPGHRHRACARSREDPPLVAENVEMTLPYDRR